MVEKHSRVGGWVLAVLGPIAVAHAQQSEPQWLFVRGDADRYGSVDVAKMVEVYLRGEEWKMVDSGQADGAPASSRMMVGTAADNAALRRVLEQLGVDVTEGSLRYREWPIGPGRGLILITADVDGSGDLMLFAGMDAAGVAACFSVPVDRSSRGFTVAEPRSIVYHEAEGVHFDTSQPLVIRLDRDFDSMVADFGDDPGAEAALCLSRGFEGYRPVFEAALGPGVELRSALRKILGSPEVGMARGKFAGRDLADEIRRLYQRCAGELGPGEGPRPVYHVLYGAAHGTNARSFGPDPVTGRRRVLLNLCALRALGQFEVAVIHETVHTFQRTFGGRLLDQAVVEGVATLATQMLRPETTDAQALMWSEDELRAARRKQDGIIAAFLRSAQSTDGKARATFLQLRPGLDRSGAPSRSGYFVGWLAARTWLAAKPQRTLRDLLGAPADAVFDALR